MRHPGGERSDVDTLDEYSVKDVLGHVVGTASDIGLRVDGEPGFALGGEDVTGVEIGMQELGVAGGSRQLTQQLDAFLCERRLEAAPFGCS